MKLLLALLIAAAALILAPAPAQAATYVGVWNGRYIFCARPLSYGDCPTSAYWDEVRAGYTDYLAPNRTCVRLRHVGKAWSQPNGGAYFSQIGPTQQIGYAYPC